LFDLGCYLTYPDGASKRHLAESKVKLNNLAQVMRNPYIVKDNLVQLDTELAIKELSFYRRAGGNSIIDMTNVGLARDPLALKAISLATGVNVIMGCGFYVGASHPPRVQSMSIDEIAQEIVNDITTGMDGTDVKPGIIGEIGTTPPLKENEIKVMRGAARAHLKTKLKVNVHPYCGFPGKWGKDAHKLLDILEEEGMDLSNVILSHMDECGFVMDEHKSLARRGAFIEYDCFGQEAYYTAEQWDPRDVERVQGLVAAIEAGLTSQLLISQDVCLKIHLKEYGGNGYDHILTNIIPMLTAKGVKRRDIDAILRENPVKILTIP
jgi:phosphotriesterase-related protein